MFAIELFLPLRDNEGTAFPKAEFEAVRRVLTERFGGVTAFVRAPAVGLWQDDAGSVHYDDVVVFEVMTDELNKEWWTSYRKELESRLRQQTILIRSTAIERI